MTPVVRSSLHHQWRTWLCAREKDRKKEFTHKKTKDDYELEHRFLTGGSWGPQGDRAEGPGGSRRSQNQSILSIQATLIRIQVSPNGIYRLFGVRGNFFFNFRGSRSNKG